MITDRHYQAFELIAVHHCTQSQAGQMLDPPCCRQTVSKLIKELYHVNPQLPAVKEYLAISESKTQTIPAMSYDDGMDSQIKHKF